MPGKVKVKILSGRNLPVMDRGSDTTDAYVEIKFGSITHKTDVCRKSLNPQWNSDWYRFEVDDAELQDEPLQIRLMDHDTYSANDAIGKVNISLNPMLLATADIPGPNVGHSGKGTVMSGWIPVFDTMHGIRGEVNLIVKVDLFSDINKFRQSSCGIQFFHSPIIPHGYIAQIIHGFVEELVVNDDPEYQWIDKIRTPRASNEARQVVFLRLSGQVQRKIGLKAIDLGANAVIGYTQCFDLEGDVGVVARGIGTAVTLVKIPDNPFSNSLLENTVAEERTLKYFDLMANNNNNSNASNANSNENPDSNIPDKFGVDTKINKNYYCNDRNDEEEESIRRPGNMFRRISHLGHKMLSIPNRISDAIRDRTPKRKSADDDEGLRMGALLVASIMSTDVGKVNKVVPPKVGDKKRKGILKNSSSTESNSTTRSTDPNKAESIIINVDNLRSIVRQMIEEQKGTDQQQHNWIVPEETPVKSKSATFLKLFDEESSNSNDEDPSSSSLSSSSSISFEEDVSQNNKNLCLLQALLNEAQDDDGYEIFIKPEIKLTIDDDAATSEARDTIIEQKKEIIIKKITNKSSSSQPSTTRNSRQSLIIRDTNNKRSNSVQFAAPSLLKSHSFSMPYNLSKLNTIPYNKQTSVDNAIHEKNTNNNITSNNTDNAMLLYAHSIDNFIRNEMSASPNKQQQPQSAAPMQTLPQHIRTESIGGRVSTAKNIVVPASTHKPELAGSGGNAMTGGGIGISTAMFRRSSDSDLSVTPKGNSLTSGDRIGSIMRTGANIPHIKQPMNQENLDMLEYPFLTISTFPSEFILHLGATVAARSVKLLERVPNPDEPETRDSWWTELRMEIRSHARALGCNVVIGYSEVTTISEEVCVLSATGTAAVINFQYTGDHSITSLMTSSLDRSEFEHDTKSIKTESKNDIDTDNNIQPPVVTVPPPPPVNQTAPPVNTTPEAGLNTSFTTKQKILNCTICHIPYNQSSIPFQTHMKKCTICKKGKVPDVILATIEMPDGLQITGRGCLVQAQVCRPKRDLRSEQNAKEISDGLPFLEYELHRLLINKLKVKGMNAIFGLKATVAIGERMIALMATGTGVYLTSLPPAIAPKIVAGNSWSDMDKLGDLQKALVDTYDRNRDIYQLKYNLLPEPETNGKCITSDTDDSDEDVNDADLNLGNKDTCILEVDDIDDVEIIASLMERCPPEGFYVVNTQFVPGLVDLEPVRNLQMFTQVWRAKFALNQCNINFAKHFQRILQSIYYKLRRMTPCAICDLKYRLDFPENDEIQLLITGMALGLGEPRAIRKQRKIAMQAVKPDDELIFNLDEEELSDFSSKLHVSNNFLSSTHPTHTQSMKVRSKSPVPPNRLNYSRIARHKPVRERYGVDISPLSYIPGGTIEKYLGNLNFFFIRESTSVRENGGISGFVHSFITEILAIVRSHVLALNGNAMVAFYMTELILVDNPHKNQGQCIISVGGDVVHVSYKNND